MNFDNYRVEDLPQLSEEDQKKPYAKYYYEGRTEITDPEILEAIRPGHPMPLEDALSAEDLVRLLSRDAPAKDRLLCPPGWYRLFLRVCQNARCDYGNARLVHAMGVWRPGTEI